MIVSPFFKLINTINIIAPIPSIEIITFVYLSINNSNAIKPTLAILISNPLILYFIINIIDNIKSE